MHNNSVEPSASQTPRRVEAVPSLALLAAQFALHAGDGEAAVALRPRLAAALVPWACTHHHAPRAMSVLALEVGARCMQQLHRKSLLRV